jgi:hypothetical protein
MNMQTISTFHEESESVTFGPMRTRLLKENEKKSGEYKRASCKAHRKAPQGQRGHKGGQPLVHSIDGDQKILPKQRDRREIGAKPIRLTRASLHDHRKPRREKRGHKGCNPLFIQETVFKRKTKTCIES